MIIAGFSLSDFNVLIVSFFLLFWLIQMLFLLLVYLRVPLLSKKHANNQSVADGVPLPPVSVIVCARNNAEDLPELIGSLFQQQYPDLEVVVVDNCSEDDTSDVLAMLSRTYPQLRTTCIKNEAWYLDPKLFARFVGVKASRGAWVLFLDPRVRPVSSHWLQCMSSGFDEQGWFVLGYFSYDSAPGFVNQFIRCDSFLSALNYCAGALAISSYTGDLRNMAVRSSLFHHETSFRRFANVPSGEVPLFMHQTAVRSNTSVCLHPDARTMASPPESMSAWFALRRQVAFLSARTCRGDKLLNWVEPFSRVLFFASFVMALWTPCWMYVLGFFGARMVTTWFVLGWAQKRLGEKGIFGCLMLMDLLRPFFFLILHLMNLFAVKKVRQYL